MPITDTTRESNTTAANSAALARFGRGWIMRKAWSVFRTIGTRYNTHNVASFADALRVAWGEARATLTRKVHVPVEVRREAFWKREGERTRLALASADRRAWGRGSLRYSGATAGL